MSKNDSLIVDIELLTVAIRLQELIKLRNLECPGDPIRSLLLDMDFRCVGGHLILSSTGAHC